MSKSKTPKYIAIFPDRYETNSYFIQNDEVLAYSLKDGSLKERDEVYEVVKKFVVVTEKTNKLKEAT